MIGGDRSHTRNRVQHLGALVRMAGLNGARHVFVGQGRDWTRHVLIVDALGAARGALGARSLGARTRLSEPLTAPRRWPGRDECCSIGDGTPVTDCYFPASSDTTKSAGRHRAGTGALRH